MNKIYILLKKPILTEKMLKLRIFFLLYCFQAIRKIVTVRLPPKSRSKTLFWNVLAIETLFRFTICVGG